MKKVLYVFPNSSGFIQKDIRLLKEKYRVRSYTMPTKAKLRIPFQLVIQLFSMLWHVPRSNIVMCKFASYHSVLPLFVARLFNVPSVLINGGTDCVSFPSVQYGSFSRKYQKSFVKRSYKLTQHIVTLHHKMIEYDYVYMSTDFPKQGFKYHIPTLEKPITELYNGFDGLRWFRNEEKVHRTFVTAAAGIGRPRTNLLKGIDLILEVATHYTDCTFYLIGATQEFIEMDKSKNIIALPFISQEEIKSIYSKCEFYFQLSISEGFPNALSEAMLCECVPIVANVCAMPEIIGNTGSVLQHKSVDDLKQLIGDLLDKDTTLLGKNARNRILENYTEERRKHGLYDLIDKMTK